MRHVCPVLIALALAGCSSPAKPPPQRVGSGTGTLTVIVWSTVVQAPVGAQGTISGPDATLPFDTRPSPAEGVTFPALGPGLYRIDVTHRHVDGSRQRVEGAEEVYLEPGGRRGVTVVAVDRGDDIGFYQTHPAAPSSRLPLAAAQWGALPY
jgi:hypothetical protein